jgi:peptide/nickel transport system substrate-binding protein
MSTNDFHSIQINRRSLMAAGAAGAFASLFPFGPLAAQTKGGTLVATIVPEPNAMVSAFNSANPVAVISGKMVEGLLHYDFDLNPQPRLATAWQVAADGLSVTFTLREGVKWHDGKPFTSADVAFTLMELIRKHHPRGRSVFAALTAVDTPDDKTAILRLSRPSPALMAALDGWETPMLPKHVYEGTDYLKNPANNAPIGTGPFKFSEWQPGSHIILVRNDNYWGQGEPHLDRVVVRFYSDPGARVAAFEAGELHLGGDGPIPLNDVKRFQGDPRFTVETRGTELNNSLDILECNLRKGPLSKVEVRQALLHAINRDLMLKTVWYNLAEVLTGPLPKTIPKFYTNNVPAYPFDPGKAEKLLDAAGFPRGSDGSRFKLRLIAPAIGDTYDRAGQFLMQEFRRVGITLEIRSADVPTFIRTVYGEYDFDLSMFPASVTADPSIGMHRFYNSAAINKGTPFVNASGYSNPEMDKVLNDAAAAIDQGRRVSLFHDFQRIAMTDLPILPLARPIYAMVANAKVKNFLNGPEGFYGTLGPTRLEA